MKIATAGGASHSPGDARSVAGSTPTRPSLNYRRLTRGGAGRRLFPLPDLARVIVVRIHVVLENPDRRDRGDGTRGRVNIMYRRELAAAGDGAWRPTRRFRKTIRSSSCRVTVYRARSTPWPMVSSIK